MSVKNQIYFWLATCIALFGFVYLFKSVLLPFVLGIAIAYLLNPLVIALGKVKIKRPVAALVILLLFFTFILLFVGLLAPVLYRQFLEFIDAAPGYAQSLLELIKPLLADITQRLGLEDDEQIDIKALLAENSGTAAEFAKNIVTKLASGGHAFFSMLSVVIFTPIVAYFVMKEWDHITQSVEDLLPRENKTTIKDLFKQIDIKISGFVRGQITVAFILGIAYAIALTVAGLKYGALIGLGAGLLSIIPMAGSFIGLSLSVVVAYFQSYDLAYVGVIAAIFLVGQIIEGNILSPKIVGDSVGMHPLWVFFALLAGGTLFGIVGMLIAVPVAAVAGVLLSFAILKYKASPIYKGEAKPRKKVAKKKS